MEPAPNIVTERLVLRQLILSDAEALHPMLSDPATMTWWSSGPHQSLEETRDYLSWNASLDPGHRCWAITLDGDQALGWVIVITKRLGVAEVGYILSRATWGKGYGREALTAIVAHGFGAMGLHRIAADTDPDNHGSIALLRSVGFQLEGHLRSEWITHIGVRDSLIFGLLADEWAARLDMIS